MPLTKPFCAGDPHDARILVIGHDPRLQDSDTQARYAFFADYYFRPAPSQRSELAKYRLAAATYDYISYLTSHSYPIEQLFLTNLCNQGLPHAPKGRIVLIPQQSAREGTDAIRDLLERSKIEIVFAMSQQVNYWLQRLAFYPAVPDFLQLAEPKLSGVTAAQPYYDPKRSKAFGLICGHRYTDGKHEICPVLHVKNWPLKGPFAKAYGNAYESLVSQLGCRNSTQAPDIL
jgi:hypothetical protein